MKKIGFILMAITAILTLQMPAGALSFREIASEAAVLIDADTGQVLYDKNMNQRMYPASTTKIMTGILTVENSYPAETTTVSETAVDIDEPMSSNIALTPGEELTIDSAMYAMMLPSANDAANVLAEHVAGSQEAFARMMTERAKSIGAVDTNFTNAHGLHEPNHYTTALDLALITRYAAGDPLFMRYFGTDLYTMSPTNKQPSERPFTNYQYMLLSTSRFYNEDVIGGKVGFTNPAGHTMSTIATRDGRTLICVVMNSKNRDQKFQDTQKLLDYGFDEFRPVVVSTEKFGGATVPVTDMGYNVGDVQFIADSSITVLLHQSIDPSTVKFDCSLPESYDRADKIAASISLVAEAAEDGLPSLLLSKPMTAKFSYSDLPVSVRPQAEEKAPLTALEIALLLLGAVFVLFIVLLLVRRHNIKKRRRERQERLNRRMREYYERPHVVQQPYARSRMKTG